MPAFEDIAASDYDEPPEVLLEWLETSASLPEAAAGPASIGLEELPPHRHTDIHRSTSSGLMVMKPQHETVDLQDEHDPENEFGFDNLMAHAQYISSLHHGLVNAAKDPSAQDQYIEGLAAALLEFSIPEVWKDLNMQDMGRHNAEPLLSIMQNVCLVYNRSLTGLTAPTVAGHCISRSFMAASYPISDGEGGCGEPRTTESTVPSRSRI
jgi:hypothetical protein